MISVCVARLQDVTHGWVLTSPASESCCINIKSEELSVRDCVWNISPQTKLDQICPEYRKLMQSKEEIDGRKGSDT